MINQNTRFNYLLVIIITVSIFIIWDMYPLWKDYKWRYLLQQSYQTGTSLDKHYQILDNIIHQTGDFEGHIGCSGDKIHFLSEIIKKYSPKRIAEIGFNAGHSSCLFLYSNPNCSVTSFDLCEHKYSLETQDYIKQQFPNRLKIICGDSTQTVPNYKGDYDDDYDDEYGDDYGDDYNEEDDYNNNYRFDLIFVDGGHENNLPYLDLKNSLKNLAKKGSIIIMDDTHYSFLVTQWLKLKYTFTVDSAWEHFLGKNIKQIGSIRGMSLGIVV